MTDTHWLAILDGLLFGGAAALAYRIYVSSVTASRVYVGRSGDALSCEVHTESGRVRLYFGHVGNWAHEYTGKAPPAAIAKACDLAVERFLREGMS